MTRKPIVAGMFYEADKEKLEEQIKQCFLSPFGAGALAGKRGNKRIIGVIAPHAGYAFSGGCASFAYKEIAESEFADVYVLLGVSHEGYKGDIITLQDFETPLGVVKTDVEFAKKLIKNAGFLEDDKAHKKEHSIEVQLPFLQFVSKDRIDNLRIVAIEVGDWNYDVIAKQIVETSLEMNKRICFIASSDFTHFGVTYGYMPFTNNVKERMYNLDRKAIKSIEKLDSLGFLEHIKKTEATICGFNAIALAIEIAKKKGAEAELLRYYTSGDVVNDYANAVGYGAIVFR